MATAETELSRDQKAKHEEAESRVECFKYDKPDIPDSANKGLVRLCGTDIMKGVIQVIEEGGENTLHYHDGMDSFWMVLKGRAAFYGPGDKLIGEFGPFEGLTTPRGARYWFAKTSDEDLELLQLASYDENTRAARRFAVDGSKPKSNRNQYFDGQNANAPIDKSQA